MKLNKKPLMFAAAVMGAAASSLAFAPHASAAAITVVDPSFETTPGVAGDVGSTTGWNGASEEADAAAPDGSFVGYVFQPGSSMTQTVAPVLSIAANTTYTLSVYVADETNNTYAGFNGGAATVAFTVGGVNQAGGVSGVTGSAFQLETVTFDSALNPSSVGSALNIYLGATAGVGGAFASELFDNVQLSSTADAVPEPSTIALMLGGLGALALVRRMRRTA